MLLGLPTPMPLPKWKANLNKYWDRMRNDLNGAVVNEIASKLKEHLDHRTYLEITNASCTNRIEILLETVYRSEDDSLFEKFCIALEEVRYSSLAAKLMPREELVS